MNSAILLCIAVILFIILGILLKIHRQQMEFFENKDGKVYVPKIIHQTAPANKKMWPETWNICQKSWKKHFPEPEYKHIMWNDTDLKDFVRKNFPGFYKTYRGYKKNIKRIDMARYLILYKMGGIYADMDFYCNKNFYNKVNVPQVSIVESPYKYNEDIQNSLMASPVGPSYWMDVLKEAKKRRRVRNVLSATGPRLISDVYKKNRKAVNVLPFKYYNPKIESKDFKSKDNVTRHYLTSVWTRNGYGKSKRDLLFKKKE